MSPTGDHDAGIVESLMTGQQSLAVALGALLGQPMTLIEYTPQSWPAGEHRAVRENLREDLHASDDDDWWRRHQMILTADADQVFFHGYVATTWLASRLPSTAHLMATLYANEPFEQVVEPLPLTSRLADYENLGHTQIRERVLSRDDGVPVAVVQEFLWTRDGVHLAPSATPRPQRRNAAPRATDATGFPDLPVSLHLQRVHGERTVQ